METAGLPQPPHRPPSACSSLMDELATPPKLHLLVLATCSRDVAWAHQLIVRLSKNPDIEMRAVVDDVVPRMTQAIYAMKNVVLLRNGLDWAETVELYRRQAFELVEWAHLLVCVPLDLDVIAKMLAGVSDTLIAEVLRCWSPSKGIILVPATASCRWSHPSTKRRMDKLKSERKWIQVMDPILWDRQGSKSVPRWNSFPQVLEIIQDRADLLRLGYNSTRANPPTTPKHGDGTKCRKLPPEIWIQILEHAADWELAKALDIFTRLPVPAEWVLQPNEQANPLRVYEHELELMVLTGSPSSVCKKLSEAPLEYKRLSARLVRLLLRFTRIEVLEFIESNMPDMLMALDGTIIPTAASSFFPSIKLLQYWKRSRWFRDRRKYGPEAMDDASRYGHVHILDWWWRQSGMPLRYTEASLEQASAHGHIAVLQWWQDAALQDQSVVLRPGRALLWAAQLGRADAMRWWLSSKLNVAYGLGVVHTACKYGHVEVLEAWRQAHGDANTCVTEADIMCATLHCQLLVLDWLRAFSQGGLPGMNGIGQSIEFRVCEVQACLHQRPGEYTQMTIWWESNYCIRPARSVSEPSTEIRIL